MPLALEMLKLHLKLTVLMIKNGNVCIIKNIKEYSVKTVLQSRLIIYVVLIGIRIFCCLILRQKFENLLTMR